MRALAAASIGAAVAIFAFDLGLGASGSYVVAAAVAALVAAGAAALAHARLRLHLGASSRGLSIASGAATLLALVALARLSVFMADSSRVEMSAFPWSQPELQHSCLSAYYVAGRVVTTTPNIYDQDLYERPGPDPTAPRTSRKLGLFNLDVYEYPPPFLLLPRALGRVTGDFDRIRALWFGLTGGVLLLAMVWTAGVIGGAVGTRALLLAPFVWLALPTLSTLQKGNVQPIVVAGSVLAMLLFERRRPAAGGAVLAFLTLSKLYPGVLLLYLTAKRRWRAVAWSVGMMGVIVAASLVDTGWRPYASFQQHLPGLVNGRAFTALLRPRAVAVNYSLPGLVFKLKLFGFPPPYGAMQVVGWVYTLVVVGATLWAARRRWRADQEPVVWMAVLAIAVLRSPFLPAAYGALPGLWLLTLLGARVPPSAANVGATLVVWLGLNVYLPWAIDPRLLALLTIVPQGLGFALPVYGLRAGRPAEAELAAGA